MPSNRTNYVLDELQHRINTFKSSMNWYRRRHFVVKMGIAVFSATIAVLTGLKGDYLATETTSNIVLVLSSTSTVLAVWGSFLSPQESWHLYSETHGNLRALKARLEYDLVEAGEGQVDLDIHFERYQQLLTDHNKKWQAIREKGRNP